MNHESPNSDLTKLGWLLLSFTSGGLLGALLVSYMLPMLGFSDAEGFQKAVGSVDKITDPDTLWSLKIVGLLSNAFTFLIPPLFFFLFAVIKNPTGYLRMEWFPSGKMVFYAILLSIFAYLPLAALVDLIDRILPDGDSVTPIQKAMIKMHSLGDLALTILLVGVMAALGEEMMFRGILQRLLMGITPPPTRAILITAAIFSIIHLNPQGALPIFLMGALFGYVYHLTQNLWVTIIMHFLHNTSQVLMLYFVLGNETTKYETSNPVMLYVLGLAGLGACWWILGKIKAMQSNEVPIS